LKCKTHLERTMLK